MRSTLFAGLVSLSLGLFTLGDARAAGLPQPSRTVYKCMVDGKAVYSDAPCIGAQRLDIEPTRGLDTSTGRALTGRDVQSEKSREQLQEALRPLLGSSADHLGRSVKRQKLPAAASNECASLDSSLSALERQGGVVSGAGRAKWELDVFTARERFRQLGC